MPPNGNFDLRLLSVADVLATGVLVLDRGGSVRWCNTSAESMIGISRRNLRGTAIAALMPQVQKWVDGFAVRSDKYDPYNAVTELQPPLANPLMVHASLSTISGSGGLLVLEVFEVEKALRMAREEREASMSEATRALLRNLGHEVKNPLGGIRGAAQLLESELSSADQREYTAVIIEEADRLQALVDRLLAPYRRERHLAEVNLLEVLERVRNLLLAEFPAGLEIVRDYDVSAPPVMGDREQMIQVFLNLMKNAVEAMKGQIPKGTARVILKTRIARQVVIQRRPYKMALRVDVIDNGPGISEEIREKIFYPLVTGRDDGTGLGLALVQNYVEQQGGSIDVESEPGCTDFWLLFPMSYPAQKTGRVEQ